MKYNGSGNAKYIKASDLFIDMTDLERDRQRLPEERLRHLTELYGAKGQKWSDEKAGALTVKTRPGGKYAIKDGGGRWWAVMNLLKQPSKQLLCVIADETEDLELFSALNAGVHIPNGKMFMAKGSDPKNRYEHHICNVLKDYEYTTTPGRAYRTISVKAVCFAYDLGVLAKTLAIAKEHWGVKVSKSGKKRYRRLDGYAIAALAGFLFLYGKKPDFNMDRLLHILRKVSYAEFVEFARERLPAKKEHARQWAVAMCRELAHQYNLGVSKTSKLDPNEIPKLQTRVMKHENYTPIHRDVWEMRMVVK